MPREAKILINKRRTKKGEEVKERLWTEALWRKLTQMYEKSKTDFLIVLLLELRHHYDICAFFRKLSDLIVSNRIR